MSVAPILEAAGLVRRFTGGDCTAFTVLDGLDIRVMPGEFVSVVGASGCGKSTLLQLLGGLDIPDGGEVRLEGEPYPIGDVAAMASLRNARIGFVFQFHHLLRDFSAVENVMMPMLIGGVPEADARERSMTILNSLGMADRAESRTPLLSGGEQQRVALGRAVANQPAILLADEPTGNLDPNTAAGLHELLGALCRDSGVALVTVTHNPALAALSDRVLALEAGQLTESSSTEMSS